MHTSRWSDSRKRRLRRSPSIFTHVASIHCVAAADTTPSALFGKETQVSTRTFHGLRAHRLESEAVRDAQDADSHHQAAPAHRSCSRARESNTRKEMGEKQTRSSETPAVRLHNSVRLSWRRTFWGARPPHSPILRAQLHPCTSQFTCGARNFEFAATRGATSAESTSPLRVNGWRGAAKGTTEAWRTRGDTLRSGDRHAPYLSLTLFRYGRSWGTMRRFRRNFGLGQMEEGVAFRHAAGYWFPRHVVPALLGFGFFRRCVSGI
eukprot:scaffold63_cov306-Pinguiococcus_pyrenoidosus.AAC.74